MARTTPTRSTTVAIDLAVRTAEAYSAERYENWAEVAEVLLDAGYTVMETEWIMMSKAMRWAADYTNAPYGEVPASAVKVMLEKPAEVLGRRAGRGVRAYLLEGFSE